MSVHVEKLKVIRFFYWKITIFSILSVCFDMYDFTSDMAIMERALMKSLGVMRS